MSSCSMRPPFRHATVRRHASPSLPLYFRPRSSLSPSPLRRRRRRTNPGGRCKLSNADVVVPPFGVRVQMEDKSDKAAGARFVEVIGIGSRRDALLDFCLDSPFTCKSLRFWNVIRTDPAKVQLQQRLLDRDCTSDIMELPELMQSCPKAIILVASAGYGLDNTVAFDILRGVKSANILVIAVVLKPFSFEGQRRQDEVEALVGNLKGHTTFCINIDTDMLLQKDLVTLDEAVRTANNAVLLAVNAISVLSSDAYEKYSDLMQKRMKELNILDVIGVLRSFKEAKIGFGSGYNVKTTILRAIYDCPFLTNGIQDLNGIVVCILSGSGAHQINVVAFLKTFRQITGFSGEVIVSMVREPTLEANLLVTTVVTISRGDQKTTQSSILSRLAQRFPFVFNLFGKHKAKLNSSHGKSSVKTVCPSEVTEMPDFGEVQGSGITSNGQGEQSKLDSEESESLLHSENDEIPLSRRSEQGENTAEFSLDDRTSEVWPVHRIGHPSLQRKPLNRLNFTPGYEMAQKWARERARDSSNSSTLNTLSIFQLPVGVKPSSELKDVLDTPKSKGNVILEAENDVKDQLFNDSNTSWGGLGDVGVGAGKYMYDAASTLFQGRYSDVPRKQGNLSARAASMLEAERYSPKSWNPSVEMQYRGGIYRGRCQGGLPEGKGCLILEDGSMYDGIWRSGKRSGSGTYYFSNGDVFQGSWRDDVMHGKGWFYFHTGDRWFANFWKGKANGEGRFYSKSGDVWFGQFEDGWRHGQFLYIEVSGERCMEIWEQGVLLSHKQLDSDYDAS